MEKKKIMCKWFSLRCHSQLILTTWCSDYSCFVWFLPQGFNMILPFTSNRCFVYDQQKNGNLWGAFCLSDFFFYAKNTEESAFRGKKHQFSLNCVAQSWTTAEKRRNPSILRPLFLWIHVVLTSWGKDDKQMYLLDKHWYTHVEVCSDVQLITKWCSCLCLETPGSQRQGDEENNRSGGGGADGKVNASKVIHTEMDGTKLFIQGIRRWWMRRMRTDK